MARALGDFALAFHRVKRVRNQPSSKVADHTQNYSFETTVNSSPSSSVPEHGGPAWSKKGFNAQHPDRVSLDPIQLQSATRAPHIPNRTRYRRSDPCSPRAAGHYRQSRQASLVGLGCARSRSKNFCALLQPCRRSSWLDNDTPFALQCPPASCSANR